MRRIALVSLLALLILTGRPAHAQSEVSFGASELENRFPDGLAFQVTVQSSGAELVAGRLYYALRNATSTTQVVLDVQPGQVVTLRHTWDTSNQTVPPSAPVFFHWEVTDAQGQRYRSDEEIVFYDDSRFDWQVLEDENIAIWTHDRPDSFGEQVFGIAQRAITRQHDLFQSELAYQIRIIIYNDSDEFAGWHTYVSEFVGGQAFTELGITTQIVPPTGSQKAWLNDVIPHELAHLYFDQVTRHPLSAPPLWLNEGVAQYNEFRDLEDDLRWARFEILDGNLIPLRTIVGSFGNQESTVRLAYAESVSAVSFLIETYGAESLADLLTAFGSGRSVDRAFSEALGRNTTEFEADWLTWLGVPEGMYVIPTPWPTLALRPSPTPAPTRAAEASTGTHQDDQATTPESLAVATTPTVPPAEAIATPAAVASATLHPPADNQPRGFVCPAALPAILLAVAAIRPGRKRLQTDDRRKTS